MPVRHLPRHAARPGRAGPGGGPVVPGLLALLLGGGVGGLVLTAPPDRVAVAQTASSSQRVDAALLDAGVARAESQLLRASRDRTPEPPPPPPPPPPPVLPGCEGPPATGFGNGRIPASALCRIPGAKGHALRADAARAFVQLSAAHEAERGEPLCLTDTYRSYDAQVTLRRAKRGLAAPPGTSNHGTGTAVDLCDGVESFGTAAHRWMQANAGRFGWVHPSWAGPRGKRPEPWHWEFRG